MRLHDLQVGQRFTFTDKHRGKVFEIMERGVSWIRYFDVATKDSRVTHSTRKTFRMEVELVTDNRVVELTPDEVDVFSKELLQAYFEVDPLLKSKINQLYLKITGLPGRMPED